MKTVDPEIAAKLWNQVKAQIEHAVAQAALLKPAKRAEMMLSIAKLSHELGLNRGYDMGHSVFAGHEDE